MSKPIFSVVIATRDRVELFAKALESVASQSFFDIEIIVVNDGSSPSSLPGYAQVLADAEKQLGARLRSFHLVRRPRGHGQSYSLNFGVDQARGDYVAFLDDDDLWIDSNHLARVDAVLRDAQAAGQVVDLYMGNQEAWRSGDKLSGPVWLEALQAQLAQRGRQADARGAFKVDIADLLGAGGFCHLNCFIVRRELFQQIGGMDEGIRWECDRDVFLRLVDAAQHIVHHPAVTSRHFVPDPKAGTSMTTSLNQLERPLWQLRVLDKASLFLKSPLLRAHGREHKVYALKRLAEQLAAQGEWRGAASYAGQALGARFSLKWALYSGSLWWRRMFQAKD